MEIENQLAKQIYKSQLHAGEVEVMILAKEVNADLVIIDDANAKKHARNSKKELRQEWPVRLL